MLFFCVQLMHPYIIDTSLCLNLSVNNGWKPSLKSLALRVLGCVDDAFKAIVLLHLFVAVYFTLGGVVV